MRHSTEHSVLLGTKNPVKSKWRGYYELMRLHKSVMGNTLMFWPCAWGLTMAAYSYGLSLRDLTTELLLFAIGSTLLHSAACVLNDICDIDFDKKVERCKTRPLPAGIVTVGEAWILLVLLVVPATAMLLLSNRTAMLCGLLGVFPFHALYPLMKRWTYWPQAWLGLAMNWGYPVAWITITGDIKADVVWVFFFGTVCWTIVYDTIYACQDREDDVHAGVKSTAVLFGDYVRPILIAFTVAFLGLMTYAGMCNGQSFGYYFISCGGSAIHFAWQFLTWHVEVPEDGGAKFQSNGVIGCLIWLGMLLDYFLDVRSAAM